MTPSLIRRNLLKNGRKLSGLCLARRQSSMVARRWESRSGESSVEWGGLRWSEVACSCWIEVACSRWKRSHCRRLRRSPYGLELGTKGFFKGVEGGRRNRGSGEWRYFLGNFFGWRRERVIFWVKKRVHMGRGVCQIPNNWSLLSTSGNFLSWRESDSVLWFVLTNAHHWW